MTERDLDSMSMPLPYDGWRSGASGDNTALPSTARAAVDTAFGKLLALAPTSKWEFLTVNLVVKRAASRKTNKN